MERTKTCPLLPDVKVGDIFAAGESRNGAFVCYMIRDFIHHPSRLSQNDAPGADMGRYSVFGKQIFFKPPSILKIEQVIYSIEQFKDLQRICGYVRIEPKEWDKIMMQISLAGKTIRLTLKNAIEAAQSKQPSNTPTQ